VVAITLEGLAVVPDALAEPGLEKVLIWLLCLGGNNGARDTLP